MFKKDEINMKNIKDKLHNNLFVFKASFSALKNEGKETIEILSILIEKTKNNEKISEDDLKKIKEQLKDISKISTLLPLIILPGSPITIPIIYKLADKLNINLTPSSFKDLKDKIEELKLKDKIEDNIIDR